MNVPNKIADRMTMLQPVYEVEAEEDRLDLLLRRLERLENRIGSLTVPATVSEPAPPPAKRSSQDHSVSERIAQKLRRIAD